MKILYIIIIIAYSINSYSQTAKSANNKTNRNKTANKSHKKNAAHILVADTARPMPVRESITEKYLKGPENKNQKSDTSKLKNGAENNPFASGVHASPDAGEKFDTLNETSTASSINNTNAATTTAVAAPNDTVFNANTINDNGLPTNSGAVDHSASAQFGQTNWGNTRSTVGEGQWTVPPPVTASFNKEFPAIENTAWSRSSRDTSIYSARYQSGNTWITANFNTSGQRLDMRTEMPLASLPRTVSAYISKLPGSTQVTSISKWQVLGKADVYQIETRTGKTIYVSNEGNPVNY